MGGRERIPFTRDVGASVGAGYFLFGFETAGFAA